jgi:xanthine/uracil/vitamin C permease (AzgA family)
MGQTLVTLGDLTDYHIWLSLMGLVITGSFMYHQVSPAARLYLTFVASCSRTFQNQWLLHT